MFSLACILIVIRYSKQKIHCLKRRTKSSCLMPVLCCLNPQIKAAASILDYIKSRATILTLLPKISVA